MQYILNSEKQFKTFKESWLYVFLNIKLFKPNYFQQVEIYFI